MFTVSHVWARVLRAYVTFRVVQHVVRVDVDRSMIGNCLPYRSIQRSSSFSELMTMHDARFPRETSDGQAERVSLD